MNNNQNFVALVLVVGLVLGGIVGLQLSRDSAPVSDVSRADLADLGRALDYDAAQYHTSTFDQFSDIITDLNTIASSTGHGNRYTAATWDPGSFSSSTQITLDVTTADAAVGDFAIASLATVTSTGQWFLSARVTGSGTTTLQLVPVPGSAAYNAGLDLSTSTYYLRVIPQDAVSILSSISSSP